jgi:hypothetical protein
MYRKRSNLCKRGMVSVVSCIKGARLDFIKKSPPHFRLIQFRLLGPRGHKPRKNQRQRAAFAPFSSYACRARTVASTFLICPAPAPCSSSHKPHKNRRQRTPSILVRLMLGGTEQSPPHFSLSSFGSLALES